MINKKFVALATCGPFGYFPAPGTVGTIITLPFVYLLSKAGMSGSLYLVFLAIISVFSLYVIEHALAFFKKRDPSEIILDEVVGTFFVFYGISITSWSLLLGFILFRFFDVIKPFGIKKCELLYGSLGVVVDDIFAGVIASVVMRFIFYYWLV